ncbi:MAG: hypothetical protein WCW77_00360 [Patescibacteria group bacterium]|jgi:hypothetical protein
MADNNIINDQNKPADKEPTLYDVLDAINVFATKTDERLENIESTMVTKDFLEKRLTPIELTMVTKDFLEKRLAPIEANMVTRDYLDDKLGDLKGDLIVTMRKEDAKLRILIEILRGKSVISEDEEKRILSMEPFPKLYVS